MAIYDDLVLDQFYIGHGFTVYLCDWRVTPCDPADEGKVVFLLCTEDGHELSISRETAESLWDDINHPNPRGKFHEEFLAIVDHALDNMV